MPHYPAHRNGFTAYPTQGAGGGGYTAPQYPGFIPPVAAPASQYPGFIPPVAAPAPQYPGFIPPVAGPPPGMRWDATLGQWMLEEDGLPSVANPAAMAGRPDVAPVVPPVANPAAMVGRPDVAPVVPPVANPAAMVDRPDVAPVVPPVANPAAMVDRPDVAPVVPPVANPAAMVDRPDIAPVVPPVANPAAMVDRPDIAPVVPPVANPAAMVDRPDIAPVVPPVANPAAMVDRPDIAPVVPSAVVNVEIGGGEVPALTQDELANLMESTLGLTPAEFAAGGGNTADMDANGDGSVTQDELEAYAGEVYQFDMPDAALTGVTDLNQMAINYLSGTGEIPAISNFLDDLSIKHDQQAADLEQSIVNRGITDSTIADRMRYDLSRNQSNESAMMETNLMQNIVPMITQTGMGYEGITDQDRAQSLGEFFQFLDRQTAENRWTTQQQAQALSLMLNALGMGTITPSMPAFNIPAGQPGAGQSIGQLLGNLGTAYLGSGADLSWLGG